MSETLTFETIEAMDLKPGDLVAIKRDEGSIPIVLEGMSSALARAYPTNTFVLLPPGMDLEKMDQEELRKLAEKSSDPRQASMAYLIRSNGRSRETVIIDPQGEMVGHVTEMRIIAKADNPLIEVELLKYKTDEDGKIVVEEPPMIAVNARIPEDQVKTVEQAFIDNGCIYTSDKSGCHHDALPGMRYCEEHATPDDMALHIKGLYNRADIAEGRLGKICEKIADTIDSANARNKNVESAVEDVCRAARSS